MTWRYINNCRSRRLHLFTSISETPPKRGDSALRLRQDQRGQRDKVLHSTAGIHRASIGLSKGSDWATPADSCHFRRRSSDGDRAPQSIVPARSQDRFLHYGLCSYRGSTVLAVRSHGLPDGTLSLAMGSLVRMGLGRHHWVPFLSFVESPAIRDPV